MKDYRSFKRYFPCEWENDKTWLGKRMSFLWDMRNFYFEIYIKNGLNEELQIDFYEINNDEIVRIASEDNRYRLSDYRNWSNWTIESLSRNLYRLEKLKKRNKKEFLKKCNCYLYTFITENKIDQVLEYRRYYEGGM